MKVNREVVDFGLELVSEEMTQKIEKLLDKTGGYCPCVPKRYHSEDVLCHPCREARENGNCHCGLYRKVGGGKEE